MDFPIFGVPLWFVVGSVATGVLWVIANLFLQLPSGYGWMAFGIVAMCVAVAVPVILYAFFFRLARKRHGNRTAWVKKEPAPLKVGEMTLAELTAVVVAAARAARE